MDEKSLFENLVEELVRHWEIVPTGGGLLIVTDWELPNEERIEIQVRTVGEREDLYVATDGGSLYNFFFTEGVVLDADEHAMNVLKGVMRKHGVQLVDYQIVKGANDETLPRSVKDVLEAVKDASLLLWHRLSPGQAVH